jgi:1,2-diacylglycerol 3-beta-galactosyltransferase
MDRQPTERPRIIFLFSDTGGGHRSASEAIIEAINLEFPGRIDCQMVDIFYEYAPAPLNKVPKIYLPLSKHPDLWRLMFRVSNGHRRITTIQDAFWPYVRRAAHRLVAENPCSLFVSVHLLSNIPMLRAMRGSRTPFVIMVTDMVSVHAGWYDRRATRVLVPTEVARQRGLELGLSDEQLVVVGQPVADRFCHPSADKQVLRRRYGWPAETPVLLMVGGGEGMGPLEKMALAIDEAKLPCALAIIAGRNVKLKQRLEERAWNIPVKVYGFVKDMPDLMQAADMIATKAGPGTISEAFIAGLPILLYDFMPGQEEGNVTYVVEEGAGLYPPGPEQVVNTLRKWLQRPEIRQQVAAASLRLARPDASRRIARVLAEQVGIKK